MLANDSGVSLESDRTDSGKIPLRNKGTRERNKERGSRLLTSANVDTREDSLVSVGAVIDAGLWASGERHPIVRVGDRAEIPHHVRAAVWYRDRGRCRLCDGRSQVAGPWHLDHIKPWSAGGSDSTDNLRVLCEKHNEVPICPLVVDAYCAHCGVRGRTGVVL